MTLSKTVFKGRSRRQMVAMACAAVVTNAALAQVVYDISQISGSAIINGAYFFPLNNTSVSGTGVYNTFVGIGNNTVGEEGYNATARPVMPDVATASTRTMDITVSQVPFSNVTIGSTVTAFYTFGLDINESGSDSYISLDALQVWVRSTPLTTAATLADLTGSGAKLVYDMDDPTLGTGTPVNTVVLMNYLLSSSGSGQADMSFLLPKSLIDTATGTNGTWYVYLYSKFGTFGTYNGQNFDNTAGFEEWQRVSGLTYTPPDVVPEAGTTAAGVALAGVAGGVLWRRRRAAKAQA